MSARKSIRMLVIAPVLVVVIAVGLAGCTSERPFWNDEPAEDGPTGVLESETQIDLLRGKLPKQAQARLTEEVSDIVDGWVDAAYGGTYPRGDFSRASFPGFTRRAKTRAVQDKSLMTNARIGDRIDAVSFSKRRVRADVLAVEGAPVGVTARFTLGMDVSGEIERSERMTGKLYLMPFKDSWRVFAYDIKRGTR